MRTLLILAALVMIAPACGTAAPAAAERGLDQVDEVASPAMPDPTTPIGSAVPSTSGPIGSAVPSTSGPIGSAVSSTMSPTAPRDVIAGSTVEAEPVFEWSVAAVDEANRAEVASTWRPECPVSLEDLRVLAVSHWNNEGAASMGRLVVRHDLVEAVVTVFERLFEAGFPIERMVPIDRYGGDDQASMRANNTSAFNCREISGSPGVWSQHAYGGAIDVNPLVNPWVQGTRVDPPEGEPYADRDLDVPGLIRPGDVVTQAFAEVGWGWGGNWTNSKDYQHFSWNGL